MDRVGFEPTTSGSFLKPRMPTLSDIYWKGAVQLPPAHHLVVIWFRYTQREGRAGEDEIS